MKITTIGGGPAGLYLGILLKKADPRHEIHVIERNRADDTFGFGVVFSDATLDNIRAADGETYDRIAEQFAHWDDIDIFLKGEQFRSTGHGFAGLSRMRLLEILQTRCIDLDVNLSFETEVADPRAYLDCDLLVGADGVSSLVRATWADRFEPELDWRPNRFVWLGTTVPFGAFTFHFKSNAHGLWRVHAYRYAEGESTFIVECTEETFRNTGLDENDELGTLAYCTALFAEELDGHDLIPNRSIWRQFPTISNKHWSFDNVVLIGDAVHTAHFSIGSGTKLAMEDSIGLAEALAQHDSVRTALAAYEAERRTAVASIQRAAQVSLQWFEDTERYFDKLEPIQFSFSLLTRSLRVTHENLRLRDPEMVAQVDRWFADGAAEQAGLQTGDQAGSNDIAPAEPAKPATPPMFTPFRLRDVVLNNRVVVSPMCQYSAVDGTVADWHLVHLGSRAIGGAGLVIAEMTAVAADARISPGCAGLYTDAHTSAWRRVTDFIHANSDSKVGLQLGHAGRKGATKRLWDGDNQPLDDGGWPLIAASAIPYSAINAIPKAMDRSDMDRVRDEFVEATKRADAAGFDLVELHLAHGYLLASFISPLINHRDDAYGGDIAGRARFPLEVFEAMRATWPAHKPMSARISATDWAAGGLSDEDAVALAKRLKDRDCDIIDVSAGQTVAEQRPRYGRLFQTPFADRIRLEAGVATMTVGNVSSYSDVNSILAAGRADLCVLARAHLFDPYWTRHAARSLEHAIDWPDPYKAVAGLRYKPRFE